MGSSFGMDIRYGLRQLRNSPGFAAAAFLTLALGIGANTAMFSIVNAVLLRSLPYRDADALVKIAFGNPGIGLHDVTFSIPELQDLRTRAGVFEEVSAAWGASVNLTGASEPVRLELMVVSPNYFSMLGASPQIGRLFGPEDEAAGFAQAVVISDGLWRRSYGSDPGVLGRDLRLDNDLYTIVGVLPPGFRHPGRTISGDVEVWATAGFAANPFAPPARGSRQIPGALGRLKPGVSLEQAQARLTAMADSLRAEFPGDYPPQARWAIEIQPMKEALVGDVRPMLLVLMGAVILIVLIASANIAGLLLARASGRQREIAVRLAMGASGGRIVRQMLTEALILSSIAGVAGVATAAGGLDAIVRLVPSRIPRLSEVGVDWSVATFALLITVLTGVLFGLAPAIHAAKSNLVPAIKEGSRGSGSGAGTSRLRSLLIAAQLALAVVLMVGAGLLLRTFWGLLRQDAGFDPSQVVAASVWLPVPNDPNADPYGKPEVQVAFARETLRRAAEIPGVEQAAITSVLPASSQTSSLPLFIEDRPVDSSQDLRAEVVRVSPEYLKAMRGTLIRGRFFTEHDEINKDFVVIVDETTARRFWPGGDPIGRRIRVGQGPNLPWFTVVGVVRDIKYDGLDTDGMPHVYACFFQRPTRIVNLVARTSLPASILEPQIRRAIQSVDPALPVYNVRSMNEVIDASLAARRFSAGLVGLFAFLALLVGSIGIYGLLAYVVGQRAHEIGIRMALGAGPRDVLGLILGKGVRLAGAGILAGLILAAAAAPMMASLLYGVRPLDRPVFLVVPVLLLSVACLASYVPARRAARVDPVTALREE